MTYPTRIAAIEAATPLLRQMRKQDPRWRVYVHENIKWHWSLRLDFTRGPEHERFCLALHQGFFSPPNKKPYYFTLLGFGGSGTMSYHHKATFRSPIDAVRRQLELFNVFFEEEERRSLLISTYGTKDPTP